MTKNQPIPWLRIGTESIAIVGSILLAFAIDAWWDERQERTLESEYLAAIIDEIDQNIDVSGDRAGNRRILERSYSDLLHARMLLRTDSYIADAGSFVMSLNRGLLYGVPTISTAIFDDLTNSGRMVTIRDLRLRRQIMNLYARIEAERLRFARVEDALLTNLVSAHTPPGLIHQVGADFSFDETKVPPEELREAARGLGAEESLMGAINLELRRRERERAYLDSHVESLTIAREELIGAIGRSVGTSDE